jgi:hypothetical protein
MVAQPFGEGNALLMRIREGMAVVDAAGDHVGVVRRVSLGVEDLHEATLLDDPALDAVPEALRARLALSGYVAIAGWADRPGRYALGEQVAEVAADHVRLAVGRDTLPEVPALP